MFSVNVRPFLLNATLKHHISQYQTVSEFVENLLNSFYNNNNILLKIRNITYYITFLPQAAYELIEAERSDDILQVQSLSI